MSDQAFVLRPGRLTMADTRRLSEPGSRITLDPSAREAVRAAHAVVDRAVEENRLVYGINTGMGSLADTAIDANQLSELQRRLILSNAAGTGELLPDRVVRRIMLLKINTLGLANSGVREAVVDLLIELFNRDAHPCIPSKGSVGASGDLAPLAHLGAAMMGEGEMRMRGETVPAGVALARLGLEPLVPAPKEGLAMVNGTQVSLALALEGLFAFEDAFAAALVAGATSIEAALGSAVPFHERIHRVRGQRGQADVAAVYRDLLANSGFRAASAEAGRVQDPYSLRCQPQVLGAALDAMRFAGDVLGREVNAMTDNPLIFADTGDVLYGGNFHAQPVGLAADVLALALAETGSMAERRIALLTDAHMSGLPPFLAADSGLNSGFMVAHVTAAALASENKALANPRSTDSLPTTANQEDYVSMATHAARRLVEMADNLAGIIAIELLASCQGVHLRRPLRSGRALEGVVEQVHAVAPPFDEDRFFAPSIEAVKGLVVNGDFRPLVAEKLLPAG